MRVVLILFLIENWEKMSLAAANGSHDAAVEVVSLGFGYPGAQRYSLQDVKLSLPKGSRCLLCGANGAGKSTLLQVLGGKYMVSKTNVKVLDSPPFHDTQLTSSGQLAYLGTTWRKSVGSASGVAMATDVTAEFMLHNVEGVDDERRQKLIDLLDIDLSWSLMHISDGQRRRVQIAMGLLKPYSVLLLDEITVDLDVVGRLDLLQFLKEECEERNATIVYATHIFDGLEDWLTHLAYVEHGRMTRFESITDLMPDGPNSGKLLDIVEKWLTDEKELRKKHGIKELEVMHNGSANMFMMPKKHMSYYRS